MSNIIELFSDGGIKLPYDSITEEYLLSISNKTLNYLKEEKKQLTIIIADNSYIQSINSKYRDKDKSTDVISFSERDNPFPVIEGETEELGDIFISIEKAKEQSVEYCVTLKEEMKRLTIHGVLHLLGYDHEKSSEDEAVMVKLENEIYDSIS